MSGILFFIFASCELLSELYVWYRHIVNQILADIAQSACGYNVVSLNNCNSTGIFFYFFIKALLSVLL